MTSNIILSTDEIIVCPNCANKFPIEQGITRQTIEKYKDEYQMVLQESSKELEERLSEENEKRMKKLKEEYPLLGQAKLDKETVDAKIEE